MGVYTAGETVWLGMWCLATNDGRMKLVDTARPQGTSASEPSNKQPAANPGRHSSEGRHARRFSRPRRRRARSPRGHTRERMPKVLGRPHCFKPHSRLALLSVCFLAVIEMYGHDV